MRLVRKRNRSSDEGRSRHKRLRQRGAKGKIATGYGRSSRGGERRLSQIHSHRARAIRHPGPPASCPADPAALPRLAEELLAAAELVTITDRVTACRDPKDDKFLELAISGHADLIVSGDADLLALNPFQGIPIVTPAIFVSGRGA